MECKNETISWEMNYKPYPETSKLNMNIKSIQGEDEKKDQPFNNSELQSSNQDNQEDEKNHSFKKEEKKKYFDQSEGGSYMYPKSRYYYKMPKSSIRKKIDRTSSEKIVDIQPAEQILTNGPIKDACNREKEKNNHHHSKPFYNGDFFIQFDDKESELNELSQPKAINLEEELDQINAICFHCKEKDHLYCLNTNINKPLRLILYNNPQLLLCKKKKVNLHAYNKNSFKVDSESGDYYTHSYREQLSRIKNTAIEAKRPRRVIDEMEKYDMEIIDDD